MAKSCSLDMVRADLAAKVRFNCSSGDGTVAKTSTGVHNFAYDSTSISVSWSVIGWPISERASDSDPKSDSANVGACLRIWVGISRV